MAEQSVCGCILISETCFPTVRKILQADHFTTDWGRVIFKASEALADRNEVIDPVTIQKEAMRQGYELTNDLLMQLMEITPSVKPAAQYAQAVRDDAVKRQTQNLLEELQQKLDTATAQEVVTEAMERLQRIDTGTVGAVVDSYEAARDFLDYRTGTEANRTQSFVPTGIKKLDKSLGGGLMKEGLYILAARPGVGKTTMGLKIADNVAKHSSVVYMSLEMSVRQMTAKRVAAETGISATRLLMGELSEEEQAQVAKALSAISERRLHLNRKPSASAAEIGMIARSVPKLDLLVVDYLGLMESPKKNASIYESVTANSKALKTLARSMAIPVLCLAQLNRQSEQRADKRPYMSDLRDSGAIEQDADGVFLLHRPARQEERKPYEPELLELYIEKDRYGPPAKLNFDFYGVNGRILEGN